MLAPVDIEDGGNQSVHQGKTLESTERPTTNNDCKGGRVGFFPRWPSIQLSAPYPTGGKRCFHLVQAVLLLLLVSSRHLHSIEVEPSNKIKNPSACTKLTFFTLISIPNVAMFAFAVSVWTQGMNVTFFTFINYQLQQQQSLYLF